MTDIMGRRFTPAGFTAEGEFWREMKRTDPLRRYRLENETGVCVGNDPNLNGPRVLAFWFNAWHGASYHCDILGPSNCTDSWQSSSDANERQRLMDEGYREVFTVWLPMPKSTVDELRAHLERRIPEIEAEWAA